MDRREILVSRFSDIDAEDWPLFLGVREADISDTEVTVVFRSPGDFGIVELANDAICKRLRKWDIAVHQRTHNQIRNGFREAFELVLDTDGGRFSDKKLRKLHKLVPTICTSYGTATALVYSLDGEHLNTKIVIDPQGGVAKPQYSRLRNEEFDVQENADGTWSWWLPKPKGSDATDPKIGATLGAEMLGIFIENVRIEQRTLSDTTLCMDPADVVTLD